MKFVQEKRLISKFFDEISQDTSKYVSGVGDTLQCLEMGAVETLIVWEDLMVGIVWEDLMLQCRLNLVTSSCLTALMQAVLLIRISSPIYKHNKDKAVPCMRHIITCREWCHG